MCVCVNIRKKSYGEVMAADLPLASSTQHQPAAPSKRRPAGAWDVACIARVLSHMDQHGTACEQLAGHIANPCEHLFGLRHDSKSY